MLRYDSDHTNGGRTWLVDRDIFKLQRMLYPTGEIRWCNCFDLATLVQVATDSVGGKPDPDNPNREFWVSLVHLRTYMIRRGRLCPLNY